MPREQYGLRTLMGLVARGSPTPPERTTEGLPWRQRGAYSVQAGAGDLRSAMPAGSGDLRRTPGVKPSAALRPRPAAVCYSGGRLGGHEVARLPRLGMRGEPILRRLDPAVPIFALGRAARAEEFYIQD